MSDIAIRVENLSKAYRIGLKEQIPDTLVGAMASWMRSPLRNFNNLRRLNTFQTNGEAEDIVWALRDVSFDVKEGEVIGIIGRNGAGKSTLLKILSRITDPTSGMATIRGRVSSLLEVGTGFHPELTGRENIYMNGTILGMSKREIDRKFDEIVDFSGVEKFLDTPIKRYSSGMKVRLAFSVAAHLEPEILLVDEVLAVGDAAFQRKCLGKMREVSSLGRTVFFVSHDLTAVSALCRRGILLSGGRIAFDDLAEDTIRHYLDSLTHAVPNAFGDNPERRGNRSIYLTGGTITNDSGTAATSLIAGSSATFTFTYSNPGGITQLDEVHVTLYNQRGVAVTQMNSKSSGSEVRHLGPGGTIRCFVPSIPLPLGGYRVAVGLKVAGHTADYIPNALSFEVVGSSFYRSSHSPPSRFCACLVAHEWSHELLPMSLPVVACATADRTPNEDQELRDDYGGRVL